ncbi:ABC transporter, fused inner membrane subunits, partial [Citreicella sp. 357]
AVTLEGWHRQGATLVAPTADTALIALAATGVALALTLACLEAETRYGLKPGTRALVLLYLPLILPQIAFLPGLQVLALQSGVDGTRGAVIAAHVVFVLPYVFLSLSDPWRGFDPRQAAVARALGASPTQVFWRVRLPILLRPVLTAAAVGAAVSVGQFLPTLLLGAGRVITLTTEAVALAAGGQRRIIGVTALAQTAAAFVPFALALAIPALVFRNRRGMRHG